MKKTINTLTLKKITIANCEITGGLPIQNNFTLKNCEVRTADSICHCSRR
jgi:hypothetical protein